VGHGRRRDDPVSTDERRHQQKELNHLDEGERHHPGLGPGRHPRDHHGRAEEE